MPPCKGEEELKSGPERLVALSRGLQEELPKRRQEKRPVHPRQTPLQRSLD